MNTRLAVGFIAVTAAASFVVGTNAHSDQSSEPVKVTTVSSDSQLIEQCEHEDGSTQYVCYWNGGRNGSGDTLINIDNGRYSFNMVTGELTEWK